MSDADWVVDRGLLVLRDQINAAWPNRSKDSDGTIGDAAHAARDSDHNPESPAPAGNPDRQVDALDVTHDPAHGADMGRVSEAIRQSKDVRVKYVIFSRRIFYPTSRNGYAAWSWQPYSGSDPHTNHMHVSVNDVHHDETQLWEIGVSSVAADDVYMKNAALYDNNRIEALVKGWEVVKGTSVAPQGKGDEVWPVKALKKLQVDVTELVDRKPVAADVAAFKAALMDPEVLGALAKAINDDAAARMAS